jgi:O-Antigen ligase
MLQVFAIAVMVFPSDTVIKPVGAAGYPAGLIGVFVFGVFFVSVLLGFHDLSSHWHPMRSVLCLIWMAVLASYIFMDRGVLTGIQIASADRMLIRFAVITGIALVAAEWLRSLDDVMRVVRVLCWGAAFCGFVAVLQYWMSFDIAQYLRQIPGFVVNQENPAIRPRGSVNRVAGTATNSIEMGVAAGMLMPLAFCLGIYERDKSPFKRLAPLAMIILGVATSVSRSAVISVVIAFAALVLLMPPKLRLIAFCGLPIALGGIFVSAHGLIGVLVAFFAGASKDPSVQYRTHDYPLASQLWQAAPWFGHGPGTYIPADSLNIFDNQYLNSVVELGAVGVVALLVLLAGPAIVAITAWGYSTSRDLRLLCAALVGSAFAATVCSFTFDSMTFPMFVNVHAIVIGLVGACWRLAAAESHPAGAPGPLTALAPRRFCLPQPAGNWSRRAES